MTTRGGEARISVSKLLGSNPMVGVDGFSCGVRSHDVTVMNEDFRKHSFIEIVI